MERAAKELLSLTDMDPRPGLAAILPILRRLQREAEYEAWAEMFDVARERIARLREEDSGERS